MGWVGVCRMGVFSNQTDFYFKRSKLLKVASLGMHNSFSPSLGGVTAVKEWGLFIFLGWAINSLHKRRSDQCNQRWQTWWARNVPHMLITFTFLCSATQNPLSMIIPGSILSRTGWVENSTGQVLVTPGDCSAYQLSGITTLKPLNVIIIIHQHGALKTLVFIPILSIVSSQSSSINLAKKLAEAIPSDKSIIRALPDFLKFILSFSILYHIWHLWKRIISQTMCARMVFEMLRVNFF